MNDRFNQLIKKFKEENNYTGELLSGAVQEYLDRFTNDLKQTVLSEKKLSAKPVNKVFGLMVDADKESDYSKKNMFSVLKNTKYNILSSDKDDTDLIEMLNTGITKAIAPKKDYELYDPTRVTIGYVFADVSLENIENLVNKDYYMTAIDNKGNEYELRYRFQWSEYLVHICKKMWTLSKVYKDETPILYMPYASKFFRIIVDVEPIISIAGIKLDKVDLRLTKNNINENILLNKTLIWNVKFDSAGCEIEPEICPVGSITHRKYRFKNLLANQYIMPVFQTWPTYTLKVYNEKEVEYDFESRIPDLFEKITIYAFDEKEYDNEKIYASLYNLKGLDVNPRIRSISDINYELSKFSMNSVIKELKVHLQKPNQKDTIFRCSSEMTIYEKGRFGYKNTNKVYIEFMGDKSSNEFIDYSNFILGYLTYCYPEIGWEGVA